MNSKESEESEKEKPFYSAKMGAILHSKGMIGVKRCLQNPIAISPKVTSRLRVQKEAKKAKNALLVEMEREMSSLRGGAPQKWKMENEIERQFTTDKRFIMAIFAKLDHIDFIRDLLANYPPPKQNRSDSEFIDTYHLFKNGRLLESLLESNVSINGIGSRLYTLSTLYFLPKERADSDYQFRINELIYKLLDNRAKLLI